MSTDSVVDTTDIETTARGRVAALVAEHGLPEPVRVYVNLDLWAGDEEGRARAARRPRKYDKGFISVTVRQRSDVARWAQVLGTFEQTKHRIYEYEDENRRWCAEWAQEVRRPAWLPDLTLIVVHSETRWIDAPAATS